MGIDTTDPALRDAMLLACQRIVRLTGAVGTGVVLQQGAASELIAHAGPAGDAPLHVAPVSALAAQAVRQDAPLTLAPEDGPVVVAAPLRCGGTVVGAVVIVRTQRTRPGDLEMEQLVVVAEAVSTTLELHWAGQRMRASEAQYRLLFMSNPLPMYVSRFEDRRMLAVNPSMLALYRYSEAQFLTLNSGDLLLAGAQARARMLASTSAHRRIVGLRRQHRKSDGTPLEVEVWTDEIDFEGAPARLVLIYDVTERVRAEHKLEQLAFFDTLTGLPNRALLTDNLQRALAQSAAIGRGGAMLLLDLDDFKRVNETWGHDEGDRLLQEVGRRLAALVRPGLAVGRPGGDEFVVLLESLSDSPHELQLQLRAELRQVLAALNPPYRVAGVEFQCNVSVGIVPFGLPASRGLTVPDVFRQADIALYEAKGMGRNAACVFDQKLQDAVTARTALEVDLRQALEGGGFVLYFQPQIGGDRVIGVEALVRWEHERRGRVSPADFIPVCEESGLIVALGQWILDDACATLAAWQRDPAMAALVMAVNVSARQFHQPDFVERVTDSLARHGAPAHRLKLELTEGLLVTDLEGVVEKMNALKLRGVSFALDDFGTGYSSLSYLKRLPLDQLKIDQSFVRDVLSDANDAAIARTVIALGQSLGLDVIAEGVETESQRVFLTSHGCLTFQGFLYSRPLPLDDLEAFVAAYASRATESRETLW